MKNSFKSQFTAGAAALALTGALLLGGCSEQPSGSQTTASNDMTQHGQIVQNDSAGQMDRAETDNTTARNNGDINERVDQTDTAQGDSVASNQDDTMASNQNGEQVVDLDYSDRDVDPMSLPELNAKVGELKNQLAEVQQTAQSNNAGDAFTTLQERTQEIADRIQEATPDVSQDEQLDMTRKLLEVEAEVAEFDKNLTQNM